MKLKLASLLAISLTAGSVSAMAGTINVLWYTGGVGTYGGGPAQYDADIANLVAQEENPAFNVSGSVNTWDVTLWSGGLMPTGPFNVLVTASPEGSWGPYPDYSALDSSGLTEASFGSRVMLTGQDADWHYMDSPGPSNFDGPAGFLIDAINWAGSGTGLGAVLLGSNGTTDGMDFVDFTGAGTDIGGDDTVDIPSAYATFPINSGLTSGGLSDWGTSAHVSFAGADSTLWTAINQGPDVGAPITIVSAQSAAGTTGGAAPDAASTALLAAFGLGALFSGRRSLGLKSLAK
jgi:hypothetical protein